MICPVCEHSQPQGDECESCGKRLVDSKAPSVSIGLLADLEPTREAAAAEVKGSSVPELDPTRMPAVPHLSVERLPDLDLGRGPGLTEKTALTTGPITCRYCRHVQAPAFVCERCGIRLPAHAVGAQPPGAGGRDLGNEAVLCRDCGTPGRAGSRCGNCGARVIAA